MTRLQQAMDKTKIGLVVMMTEAIVEMGMWSM
jgi:hypothetical protein